MLKTRKKNNTRSGRELWDKERLFYKERKLLKCIYMYC